MLTVITVGVIILLALSILCFAAYRIKAKKFEFSTVIWKLASLKITILSAAEDGKPDDPEEVRPEPER